MQSMGISDFSIICCMQFKSYPVIPINFAFPAFTTDSNAGRVSLIIIF